MGAKNFESAQRHLSQTSGTPRGGVGRRVSANGHLWPGSLPPSYCCAAFYIIRMHQVGLIAAQCRCHTATNVLFEMHSQHVKM